VLAHQALLARIRERRSASTGACSCHGPDPFGVRWMLDITQLRNNGHGLCAAAASKGRLRWTSAAERDDS
jgi:hypothetical protein